MIKPHISKKVSSSKLVMAFLVAAVVAVVGSTGVAFAKKDYKPKANSHASNSQSIRIKQRNDNGYGGTNVANAVNVNLNNSNGNVLTIIINYIIGNSNSVNP